MNKKLVLIIIILVAIASAVGFLVLKQTDQKDNTTVQNTAVNMTSEKPKTTAPTQNQPGAYVDYKPGIIEETDNTKILFFHAPWCPQCRDLESDIKSSGVPVDTTIIKVDYDTNQALRQKYGVSLQTTLVLVDDEGKEVKKFVAYDDPSLNAVKNKLL